MDDLISRQAAIDALAKTAREKFNLSDEYNHYLAGLMDGESAIRRLLSAQPVRWIPCSERLPYKDGEYLCTYEDGYGRWVDVDEFIKGEWVVLLGNGTYSEILNVLAWMPLPEPWKGDADEID